MKRKMQITLEGKEKLWRKKKNLMRIWTFLKKRKVKATIHFFCLKEKVKSVFIIFYKNIIDS
jgi:hypothetical protein